MFISWDSFYIGACKRRCFQYRVENIRRVFVNLHQRLCWFWDKYGAFHGEVQLKMSYVMDHITWGLLSALSVYSDWVHLRSWAPSLTYNSLISSSWQRMNLPGSLVHFGPSKRFVSMKLNSSSACSKKWLVKTDSIPMHPKMLRMFSCQLVLSFLIA